MKNQWLTINELIIALGRYDGELKVKLEGCDCVGVASGIDPWPQSGYVIITRGNDDDDD